jgi:probable HAF family extracellular repeat protein
MNTVSKRRRALVLGVALTWSGYSQAQTYSVTQLNGMPADAMVTAINSAGQITGSYATAGGAPDAFLYSNGTFQDLGTFPGFDSSFGQSINAMGQVTGYYRNATTGAESAFLYSNGTMQNLGTLLGLTASTAYGINAVGQVTGSASTNGGGAAATAFIYGNGSIQNLGTLPGFPSSAGESINAAGQVAGVVLDATNGIEHAFLYSNGTMKDLGTLGGINSNSAALSINSAGEVTGASYTAGGVEHAFLYSDGALQDLGTLPGFTSSVGQSINTAGQVVGQAFYFQRVGSSTQLFSHAFLDNDGQMVDLNSLLSASDASLYTLTSGVAINDSGQILADGYNDSHLYSYDYLLTPTVPLPESAWLLLSGIAGLGVMTRRRRLPSPGCSNLLI